MSQTPPPPSPSPCVLLIEDDPSIARLLRATLEAGEIGVAHADTGTKGLEALSGPLPDMILLDLQLPDMHGFEVLQRVRQLPDPPPTVVITGESTVDTAVSAMREGAIDFIGKPFRPARVLKVVTEALDSGRMKREIETIREDHKRDAFCGLVGASAPMQAVYRMIEKVAHSKASVFITGESGTGKDVVAHAIHTRSGRDTRPFVALNCGAIPKDLMESELFGHVKGAFTGATSDRAGAARRAHKGTLFLDELGEMEINLQSKLLRFIQTGDVQPVGGGDCHSVDVRFICATNRNPERAVQDGLLREDLFYRLNVVPVHLPPLRERGQDVMLIAHRFLDLYAREEGKHFAEFAPGTEAALLAHHWPGNVRELQNVIRRIVVLHDGDVVEPDMLPPLVKGERPAPAFGQAIPSQDISTDLASLDSIRPLWLVEKEEIERAVAICQGNVVMAAACLGINPSTIYRKRQHWAKLMQAAE